MKKVKEKFSKYYDSLFTKKRGENPPTVLPDSMGQPEIKLSQEEREKFAQFCGEILEKFHSRRSIRKYATDPIEWKIIYDIIDASLNAPMAGNVENVHVVVVQDKKRRTDIARIESQQFWMCDAPYLLVVVRDNHKLSNLYPGKGELYASQNSASVVENILMLAHIHGFGACWVQACDNEVLKDYLGVSGDKWIDAVIPIGYPDENPEVMRDLVSTKIFFESYGNQERKSTILR